MDEPKPAGMRSPGLRAMGLSQKTSPGLWDRVLRVKLGCEHPQGSPRRCQRCSTAAFPLEFCVVLLSGRALCIQKTKVSKCFFGLFWAFSAFLSQVGDPGWTIPAGMGWELPRLSRGHVECAGGVCDAPIPRTRLQFLGEGSVRCPPALTVTVTVTAPARPGLGGLSHLPCPCPVPEGDSQ